MTSTCIPSNELTNSERLRFLELSLPQIDDTPFVIGFAANAGVAGANRTAVATALDNMNADWYLWAGDMVTPAGVSPVTQAAVIAGFASFNSFAANKSTRAVQAEDVAGDADASETIAVYPDQFPSLYFKKTLAGGRVALFVVDTEQSVEPGTTQGDWLVDELASAAEPWRIVMMGNPPRTTVNGGGDADGLNLGWLNYLGVHLVVTGDSIITEHLNVTPGLDIVNASFTSITSPNARGASVFGEVHTDTQTAWPTYVDLPNGGTAWDRAVGRITVRRDRLIVEFVSVEDEEVLHTFTVERDSVAIAAPSSCCPSAEGGGGGLSWENAAARENVQPEFIGQLGTQQDDSTIWISTGVNAGDWELYEDTQTFANAAARTGAVPTRIGQLGIQIDTNILYRGSATTAGSWTAVSVQDTQTFANAAARTAATPNRVGQLGYQTDTNTLWKGTATSAGSWSLVQETMAWANDAARAALVPRFTGQLGTQLDTGLLYRSTGTSAGNWTSVEVAQPNVVFLESTGNDSSALIGYRSRPYLTLSAALAAASVNIAAGNNTTLDAGIGTFAAGNWTDPGGGNLTIIGRGEGSTILPINLTGQGTFFSDKSVTLRIIPNQNICVVTNCVVERTGSYGTTANQFDELTVTESRFTNKIDTAVLTAIQSQFNDVSFSGNASIASNIYIAKRCSFNQILGGTNEGMQITLLDCQVGQIAGRASLNASSCQIDTVNIITFSFVNLLNCSGANYTMAGSSTVNTGIVINGVWLSGNFVLTVNFDGSADFFATDVSAAAMTTTINAALAARPVYTSCISPASAINSWTGMTWQLLFCQHTTTDNYDGGGATTFNRTGGLEPTTGAVVANGAVLVDVSVEVYPA